jgi:hypothetical protein
MQDTFLDIKKQMCAKHYHPTIEYSKNNSVQLINKEQMFTLQRRLSLFNLRQDWITLTMAPLYSKLNNVYNSIGAITALTSEQLEIYSKQLKVCMTDITNALDKEKESEIWKGNNIDEKEILDNSFFKSKVESFMDLNMYSEKVKELDTRYEFVVKREEALDMYSSLRTYLKEEDIQKKRDSILNENDINRLIQDNEERKRKLEQSNVEDGENKRDDELNGDEETQDDASNENDGALVEETEESASNETVNQYTEQDTDDEDIKTFKFTPTL